MLCKNEHGDPYFVLHFSIYIHVQNMITNWVKFEKPFNTPSASNGITLKYSLLLTVPTPVRPQQVAPVTGGTNSPSVVKQMQEQENKSTDSPTQASKPEQQQDEKEEEAKKEKKKVKKPKTPKV